jgi:hypothetical protein
MDPVPSDTKVRYIKLGRGGGWEKECIGKGIARWGFAVARDDRFPLCIGGQWPELKTSFEQEGADKRTASSNANQTKIFFEDKGLSLWITFFEHRMYCGCFEGSTRPERYGDNDSVSRAVAGGWRCTDMAGRLLTRELLAESPVIKLMQYPATSCQVRNPQDLIRRINAR